MLKNADGVVSLQRSRKIEGREFGPVVEGSKVGVVCGLLAREAGFEGAAKQLQRPGGVPWVVSGL